jgi:hypothetical protein
VCFYHLGEVALRMPIKGDVAAPAKFVVAIAPLAFLEPAPIRGRRNDRPAWPTSSRRRAARMAWAPTTHHSGWPVCARLDITGAGGQGNPGRISGARTSMGFGRADFRSDFL